MNLQGFEHATKLSRIIPPDMLRINDGVLRLSRELYARMGEPRKLEFFYNATTRQIVLRKALADSETAFNVKARQLSVRSLRKRIGFPLGDYFCIIKDGALIATYQEI